MEKINRIKEVLVSQDISQKKLAEKLGKNPNTIASLCNNKSQPYLKDLKKIAQILDVDIRELLIPTKEKLRIYLLKLIQSSIIKTKIIICIVL